MKGNLRVIILKELEKQELSGYGLMKTIHEHMGKKPSPGSMYPQLESLHEENLIKKRTQGKKDLYSLTPKGKLEIKKFFKMKEKLFKDMEKNIKLWGLLYNEDVSEHLTAIQTMKGDVHPFKEIDKESQALKKSLFKIYTKGQLKTHAKKINEILKKATKEIKKLT